MKHNRIFIFLLPLLSSGCHNAITSPYLLSGSTWIEGKLNEGLWLINLGLFVYISVYTLTIKHYKTLDL